MESLAFIFIRTSPNKTGSFSSVSYTHLDVYKRQGVQSTNEKTLREIDRPMDFAYLSRVVRSIKECNNVHLHLDLIAGLPFEDYESFSRSFDDVFALRPHQLQLGFLKVLKGSPMEKRCVSYGLKHTELPPYEVMETNWITYDDLIKLKSVEEMVEVYYNSCRLYTSRCV